MPKFRVPILQDAWVRHEATVEAASPADAAEIAYRAWKEGNEFVKFEELDAIAFDHIEDPRDDLEAIEEME